MNFFKLIFRNFPNVAQNKFTLGFKDTDLEDSFHNHYTEQYLIHGRICHVLAAIFYSFFGIFDEVLFPDSWHIMWFIRYAVVLPMFVIGFFYSFSNSYKKYWQLLFFIFVMITGSGYVYMTAISPLSVSYSLYTGIIFCLFFGYAFIRLRFVFSSLAGWLLTIGYIIVVILGYDTSYTIVLNNIPHIIGLNFLGMFIGYSMELAVRHNFLLINELAKSEKDLNNSYKLLEKKVKTRTKELEAVNLELVEDRKKRLEVEAHLRQSQKMESIGTLAGGIAHDFNNILAGIFGYTELLQIKLQNQKEMLAYIDSILKAGNRAKALVEQILTFSRQSVHKLKPIYPQIVINEALKLIESSLPTTISINKEIQKNCGLVLADHTQLHQIIMNLCTNAYHAMEESGGELNVFLREIEFTVENLQDSTLTPGKYIQLTVVDTGTGIERGMIERVFDPYFTTKDEGKGTGLGLAVIHGIVKSHGGHISVDSEPGIGSEFCVYLPMIKATPEVTQIETQPIQKGNEHILLVDDQKDVIEIERQMLEVLGYQVTTKTSSMDALDTFRENPEAFDLVVTDMTMPNMTGDRLAEELIVIRPSISIILCTGFSETISKEKAVSMGIKGFLMKPVVIKELSSTIRNVLDNMEKSGQG